MDIEAPAPKSAGRGRKTPTHSSKSTPKSSAKAGTSVNAKASASAKGKGKAKAGVGASATPTKSGAGPAGREKKRQIKLGQTAKQRARDAKMDGGFTAGGADATAANDDDEAGSFGDDESEVERFETDVGFGYGYQDEDDVLRHGQGLPDEFAGQEIEDLHYGAGDVDLMGNVMSGMWSDEEDVSSQLSVYWCKLRHSTISTTCLVRRPNACPSRRSVSLTRSCLRPTRTFSPRPPMTSSTSSDSLSSHPSLDRYSLWTNPSFLPRGKKTMVSC